MRLTLAAVALLAAGGVAMAQTTSTTNAPAPSDTTGAPGAPGATTNNPSGAQTPAATANSNPSTATSSPSAVQTRNTTHRTRRAPVPGANSFTMAQARSRIAAAGYSSVTGLKKDSHGVWRGQAQKDGSTVPVALDYQGNVTSGQQ